jgi:hypothetical protein
MTSAYSSSKLGLMLDRRRRIAGSMIGKRRDVLDRLTVLAISSDPYRQEPRRIEGNGSLGGSTSYARSLFTFADSTTCL